MNFKIILATDGKYYTQKENISCRYCDVYKRYRKHDKVSPCSSIKEKLFGDRNIFPCYTGLIIVDATKDIAKGV